MRTILSITLFFLSITLPAQENECDCLQVIIESLQSIERGASEETVQKRFEKENKRCDELSEKIGSDFEKNMASCENFSKALQLMAGGKTNTKPNPEICKCVDLSIQILKEFGEEATEEAINKVYQKESESCGKLSDELGEEQFGLQMMNCESFGDLMELLMSGED